MIVYCGWEFGFAAIFVTVAVEEKIRVTLIWEIAVAKRVQFRFSRFSAVRSPPFPQLLFRDFTLQTNFVKCCFYLCFLFIFISIFYTVIMLQITESWS